MKTLSISQLRAKGKKIKDLPDIILSKTEGENNFSFQPIYDLGRYISEGNKDFAMRNISEIHISEKRDDGLKEKVIAFFTTLAEDILFHNLKFAPVLIDFVVFDPEDRRGERFHIAICSNDKNLIEMYRNEVNANIKGNKIDLQDQPQERGPILTNSNIYKSPYFFRNNRNSHETNKYFNRIQTGKYESKTQIDKSKEITIYFGSFKANRINKLDKQAQKGHIELFFDIIQEQINLGKGLIKTDDTTISVDSFQLNSAILVPLLRPAASYSGDRDFRLRGGGIFIYGNIPNKVNITELVARLQHFFYRNILDQSHAQIVYDYLRHEGANTHIHDFKTFLTNELITKLDRLVEKSDLGENNRNSIKDILNSVELFKRTLVYQLEAYRDFILHDVQSPVTSYFNSNKLKEMILEDASDVVKRINIKFVDEINDPSKSVRASIKVLKRVFMNLFTNTDAEYKKKKIPVQDRETIVKCYLTVVDSSEIFNIEYFNKNIIFNKYFIKSFGIKPIVKDSTGLGGYFMNNVLGWLYAEENKLFNETEVNVKRYIKVENESDGVKFSFKFKIHKS